MHIAIKRVYDNPSKTDGVRLLVDRPWPRGIKKENLLFDSWIKEIAPSTQLRIRFAHEPSKFTEFEKKYREELEINESVWRPILEKYLKKKITLLYAAKDPEINHARVLQSYLKEKFNAD